MTQILTSSPEKFAVLDEIDRLVYRHLLTGMTPVQAELVRQHMQTLRLDAFNRDLKVNFRFETVPALESTRIHLELSFASIPSFDDPAQKKI